MFWLVILAISLLFAAAACAPIIYARPGDNSERINRKPRLVAIMAIAAAPIIAVYIYLNVGLPGQQFNLDLSASNQAAENNAAAIAAMPEDDRVAAIAGMVEGLAERLKANPEDIDGWRMLARSYAVLNRPSQSAAAYGEVVQRDPEAALISARGEGQLTGLPELKKALDEINARDNNDPLSLFYLGVLARENNNPEKAQTYWRRLKSLLPNDSPLTAQLDQFIEDAEQAAQ